jgi:hypothetical protein
MRKISVFNLSVKDVAIRFYLMIGVVVAFGFLGQFTLAAVLGYVVGLSFILGARFDKTEEVVAKSERQLRGEVRERTVRKAA